MPQWSKRPHGMRTYPFKEKAMFITVKLFTPEGGFVSTVTMPAFQIMPQVLVWGARSFVHVDGLEMFEEGDAPDIGDEGAYIEAFAYHVPPMVAEMPDGSKVTYPGLEPIKEYVDPRLPHEREPATPDSFGGSDYE